MSKELLIHVDRPSPINPDTTLTPGECLRAFASERLWQAERELARQGTARHEGIHNARKCLRQARAALALGSGSLGPHAERIDNELRRLCRGLSPLRDAQALIDAIQRLKGGASAKTRGLLRDAGNLAVLFRNSSLDRALIRDPDFISRRRRLLAAKQRLTDQDWPAITGNSLAAAFARGERRLDNTRRHAAKHPEQDETWHLYRRRLRRLRQQLPILDQIHPGRHRPSRKLSNQAQALGESQDDVLILRFCQKRSPFLPEQRALLRQLARARLRRMRGR